MTEERLPYGDEAEKWVRDAQELRALMESAGLTQVAAAAELDYSERAIRGFCSGREMVPRAVMYAMRWLVEHKPNQARWLQVHWKRAGLAVSSKDRFKLQDNGNGLEIFVNGEVKIQGKLEDLVGRGLVSIHTSFSPDRFLWKTALQTAKAEPDAVDLDETFGRVGLRVITPLYPGGDSSIGDPCVEFYTRDGRVSLSSVMVSAKEIDENVDALARSIGALRVNAKRALAQAKKS